MSNSTKLVLVVSVVFFLVLSFSCVVSVRAAEPSLEEVLDYFGFTNRAVSSAETFSADTYEITLYAEFAGYADRNELSYYEVGTNNFPVIFTGPEGGSDYVDPPVAKTLTAGYQFGLSLLSKGEHRYFTETSRNGDGLQHAKIYENLDEPGMFLIGFENLWGGGDKDYNDMVFSLKPKQPPVACFDYSPLYPVANETITFNASASYDLDGGIVSYQWNFGDGNMTTVNDPVITHIYTAANSTKNYTVTLTVTDNDGLINSTSTTVPVTNPSVLHISIPAGEDRTSISDPDPWLDECWLLNITDSSGTFTVRIEDVSNCISSHDTRLVIALNDVAYNNLVSLTINSITIVKNDFKHGTLRPYNLRNWPSGDVYPTWFNATLVNVGTIPPKGHTNVTVSVTFSNATGARMHFDAYGSKKSSPIPPTIKCYITYNPLSEDSTVLFSAPPIVRHYLTVTSPYGTPSGEGWYDNCTYAYAMLNTDTIDHGNGTRRVFTHWSGDASGTNYASSDSIHMDQNKTAIANWQTQYYLTLTTSSGGATDPPSSTWPDAGTMVSVEAVPDACYVFDHWMLDGQDVGSANPYSVLMDDDHTLHAVFTQVTFDLTISAGAGGTTDPVPGVYSHPCGSSVDITAIPDEGYRFDHWVLDGSPAGTANPISVLMNDNHDLEPVFAEIHTLIITVSEGGTTDPSPGTYTYEAPTNVVVEAIPSAGYLFDHWEFDSEDIGSENPITVYVGSSHALKAFLTPITYQLTITTTSGGTTDPVPGTYTYAVDSSVGVTAIPDADYVFDHWELDTVDVGSANPYSVLMDDDHVLHAVFTPSLPSLSVSIDPPSATIPTGGSVAFTSTVGGGASPYTYQWYLDGDPVSGATSSSWAFTPPSSGIYYVYVEVTDATSNKVQSDTARITVIPSAVGGYSVSLTKLAVKTPLIFYTMLLAIFGVVMSLIKRKRNRQ